MQSEDIPRLEKPRTDKIQLDSVAIRFCGDSGDGMQLTGGQFTNTTAVFGNDFATFPDFPAEIRAPKGTTFGVSNFQLQFSKNEIFTPGDKINALVAMNPAGLKTNIDDVEAGGIIIVNGDEFSKVNLTKCGYPKNYNPIDDPSIQTGYQIFNVPMSRITRESLVSSGLGSRDIDRCRNMFALGIVYWLYDRPLDTTIEWLNKYFGGRKGNPQLAEINIKALKAGYFFGETAELFPVRYQVPAAKHTPGLYRRVSGNHALALGLATVAGKAGKQVLYAGYPITPASELMHTAANLKHFGVKTFQAEDEIAAVCAAIGASFAGDLAVTATSGPGLALKMEAIGLAVMMELPLVVIDVQRAGPSTGLPTKTEQSDLLQAMFGRPGESPCIVIAPQSPADCFDMLIEAFRLAIRHMCPVILLSDGHIANGAEPWKIPNLDAIAPIEIRHARSEDYADKEFHPYTRDTSTLARPWAIPGTPGLEHRLGGLEKDATKGTVSYDPDNHDRMVRLRAQKIERAATTIPHLEVRGPSEGDVLLLGWGGTYGAIRSAGDQLRQQGVQVSTAHLRYLNPMPSNTAEVLRSFRRVLIPEINQGQLLQIIRAKYLIDAIGINETRGKMFMVDTLVQRTLNIIQSETARAEQGQEVGIGSSAS